MHMSCVNQKPLDYEEPGRFATGLSTSALRDDCGLNLRGSACNPVCSHWDAAGVVARGTRRTSKSAPVQTRGADPRRTPIVPMLAYWGFSMIGLRPW
jgi:hypothetical protein